MKSSYECELEYLLNNPHRAKKFAKRIAQLREILSEIDAQEAK